MIEFIIPYVYNVNSRFFFRNKVSLRSLSMVLRQLSTKSAEEKVMNIEESLVKGKQY